MFYNYVLKHVFLRLPDWEGTGKNSYICNGGMFEVRQQQEARIKRNFNDFVVLK